ncbi:hypothetical protein BD413DRAFT_92886 [Trametes elegans]|nr:hypothetical protein BD413DRAFT_92886 [Trametes elegans]
MFSLQTPPRRPQFSTPRVDFETPPPPRGMPDLPGPPSEDEEDDHTPVLQSREIQGDITALKTPRPPGAWLATPAPSRPSSKEPVERAGSAPPAAEHMSGSDSGLATPPATFSRATSLPPQTPAPPGGWVNTPAPDTSARKKVRFDVESETASDGTLEKRSADSSVESQANDIKPPSWGAGTLQNGDASTTSSAPAEESSVEPPPTPPSLRQRIRQKSPSIRLLDAYGREQVETAPASAPSPAPEPETAPQDAGVRVADDQAVAPATPRRKTSTGRAATPRSRSTVRMVDAMGREIQEDSVPEDDSSASPPISRSEALIRMRETLSSMAQDLSEVDGSNDNTVFDACSYAVLEERCKSSQLARSKISKSLQRVHSAEAELKSKYTPLRDRVKQYAIPVPVPLPRSFGWRLFALFILLQAVLLAIYYRYSIVQARKIFLTTYYDPFYPELYRYLVKPDTTQHTIPPCPSWSVFSAFNSLQRAGFKGVAADAWASTSCSIASYLQSFWVDVNYAQDTVRHSWPPT